MKKSRFNTGWTFHEGSGGSLEVLSGKQHAAKEVCLPHDASIEKPRVPDQANGSGNGYFSEETVHYTKSFSLNPSDREKVFWLEFEGVYQNSAVYVNNSFVAQRPYGYSNYFVDITDSVRFDKENTLKVVVKNGVPSGRWYTGGGIYRDVNLYVGDKLHLVPDGIRIKASDIEKDSATIEAEAEIEYTGSGAKSACLTIILFDREGSVVGEDHFPILVRAGEKKQYRKRLCIKTPHLWDLDTPYLYRCHVAITEGGTVLDEGTSTFGIRKLQLDAIHGLRLNGKAIKLRGGCIHHDNGIIGAAEFPHAAQEKIYKLKAAGYNAIRSAHNPISRHMLEACDYLGMLVMDEYTDVWTTSKVDFDYAMHMPEWWERDITNMVRKDYNHPCVIMYSIGNEIPETGNRFGVQWGKRLADKVRSLDDTRYTVNCLNLMLSMSEVMDETIAALQGENRQQSEASGDAMEINSLMDNLDEMMKLFITSEPAGKVTEEAFSQVDVAGYNYGSARYEMDGELYPNRVMVGSETYPKDLDFNWEMVEKKPYLIGDFSWTSWDYLGETGIGKTSYGPIVPGQGFYAAFPYKAAYCGDFNLIGDRRPVSYWREIVWGFRKKPFLCVRPPEYHGQERRTTSWGMTDAVRSWNWRSFVGKAITVETYANADEVELLLNGEAIERKKVGEVKKYLTLFETVYYPGVLELIAYRDGKKCGRDRIVTAADDTQIFAQADIPSIPANGEDICYIDVSMVDRNGILNPEDDRPVSITVEGPAVVAGFGSSSPESIENYYDMTVRPFEGRLRAAIRGTGVRGAIQVSFTAEGCEKTAVSINAI